MVDLLHIVMVNYPWLLVECELYILAVLTFCHHTDTGSLTVDSSLNNVLQKKRRGEGSERETTVKDQYLYMPQ